MNKRKSIFLSAISGNILEYYDFTVYAVFSSAIGQAFFPSKSQVIQTLSSLLVFAIGFIMRPIGGIILGYIADKYGRKLALIISMIGMTATTFVIGIIPDYSTVRYIAPILLVIMRLIQGLCISGEGAGGAIFILEHYQNLKPGFTAGIVHASNIAGTLLAGIVGIILEQLFPQIKFAWRVAFILGGIMGIIGFYFRIKVSETPIFEMLMKKELTLKTPFIHVILNSWSAILITVSLAGSASSLVYIIKTYINVFYYEVLGYSKTVGLIYLSYSSIIMMFTMPLSGYISDRIGSFKMIVISSITIVTLAIPAFILLSSNDTWKQIIALTTIAILAGFVAGTSYIFIISLFSAEERFTGVAFGYNLGVALFGGTSAVISRWLVEATGLNHAPAFYIILTSLLFLFIAYSMRKKILKLISNNSVLIQK